MIVRGLQPRRERESLQRFPQAHVVGKESVEILLREAREPLNAVRLVGTKLREKVFHRARLLD